MTAKETLPEVRQTNPIEQPKGPPVGNEWEAMKQQAAMIAGSGLAPEELHGQPKKVMVIMLKGREIGVPPMQALSHISVVRGKPTISAELMAALVQRAGHRLRVLESTSEKCTVQGIRHDDPDHPQETSFTMQEAKHAGLTSNNTWKKYPAAMLRARAISALCRFAFADVIMGASYVPEELGGEARKEDLRAATNDEEITVTEEEVEEVHAEAEDGDVLDSVRVAEITDLSLEIWGDRRAVETEIMKGKTIEHISDEAADMLIEKLQKAAERKRKANEEARTQGGGDSPEEARQQSLNDVDGVEKGAAAKHNGKKEADLPATKKQKNYLKALITDAIDDSAEMDAMKMFEDMIEKPFKDITRGEASEWINRLSSAMA